jgi:dCTP deaminase
MILSDSAVLDAIENGSIKIEPFNRDRLGSNSYDVSLSKHLAIYEQDVLDAKKHNTLKHFEIPKSGFVMQPGELYLGSTIEYTETHKHLPILDGKSSVGRLGIDIHATAGIGDVGFKGYWTLELSVTKPVRVYAGMPIGQIIYYQVKGEVINKYDTKGDAKYSQQEHLPVESMMWKNNF